MGRCTLKIQLETIPTSRGHVALANVDVWFQDEARFVNKIRLPDWGQAKSPRAIQQQQFEYVYLRCRLPCNRDNGSLAQSSGKNREVMKQHLALIAARTKPGRHAVVIMDGAGWHTMECADDFPIQPDRAPSLFPELNPIEQVWSWLRQHVLANRSFKDYDDILMPAHRPGSTLLPMWSG